MALTDEDKQWISEQLERIHKPVVHTNNLFQRDNYANWGELEMGLTMLRRRVEQVEELLKTKPVL